MYTVPASCLKNTGHERLLMIEHWQRAPLYIGTSSQSRLYRSEKS
jgi:hypothetical protein